MKLSLDLNAPVYVLKGEDDVLLESTAVELVHALVGDGDRTLMVEELNAARYETDSGELSVGPLVDAAQTPPFLTDRRVVVGRQAGVWSRGEQVQALLDYLADPLDTTSLVIVWEKNPKPGSKLATIPKKLVDAVKAAGGVVVDTKVGQGKAQTQWVDDQLKSASVKLDAGARKVIEERIGDDPSILVGLLPTLESVFGAGAKLGADDVEPYLIAEGGAKSWDLTDAIDAGDVEKALTTLHRVTQHGHPLMVMGYLTNHYTRMLALDGAGVATEEQVTQLIGVKGYPAKKLLSQANKLGSDRIKEFVVLLAQADIDMKGAKAWDAELVAEVLVARLASRTPKSQSRGRSGGSYARR